MRSPPTRRGLHVTPQCRCYLKPIAVRPAQLAVLMEGCNCALLRGRGGCCTGCMQDSSFLHTTPRPTCMGQILAGPVHCCYIMPGSSLFSCCFEVIRQTKQQRFEAKVFGWRWTMQRWRTDVCGPGFIAPNMSCICLCIWWCCSLCKCQFAAKDKAALCNRCLYCITSR